MPKLLVKHPERGDLTFTLSGERITIGRHSDNQIQINHGTVSAHHAEIVVRNGRQVLRDLGSTNHSYIQGIMFIEAELDRACRIVFGTVECEFVPDQIEAVPDEIDSLRKTVGLLRRQNDELVAKIAEQKSQIDILGDVKLFTRDPTSDLSGLRDRMKALTTERDTLAAENKELIAQVEALHAKLGIPSISQATPPAANAETARLPKPPIRLG
jgi:predicted component of type VI protein secretion system